MFSVPERDWKYLRSLKGELLEALCERINTEANRIVNDQMASHHDRFLLLHDLLDKGNKVVADCFDGWRRSNILINLFALRQHDLLTDEHLARLSAESRERLER